MRIGAVDPQNARGLVDKIVGLVRETTGTLLGNDSLIRAGEAQQEKGTERLRALRAQTEAQGQEAKADALRTRSSANSNRSTGTTGERGVQGGHSSISAVADSATGAVKQAAGSVINNDRLQEEGRTQKEAGQADGRAVKNRGEAAAHEAKASVADAKERAAANR